jgi:hypothetical protein
MSDLATRLVTRQRKSSKGTDGRYPWWCGYLETIHSFIFSRPLLRQEVRCGNGSSSRDSPHYHHIGQALKAQYRNCLISRYEEERVANKLLVSIFMQAHPALVDNSSRLLYWENEGKGRGLQILVTKVESRGLFLQRIFIAINFCLEWDDEQDRNRAIVSETSGLWWEWVQDVRDRRTPAFGKCRVDWDQCC